jgi:hypothetical protein
VAFANVPFVQRMLELAVTVLLFAWIFDGLTSPGEAAFNEFEKGFRELFRTDAAWYLTLPVGVGVALIAVGVGAFVIYFSSVVAVWSGELAMSRKLVIRFNGKPWLNPRLYRELIALGPARIAVVLLFLAPGYLGLLGLARVFPKPNPLVNEVIAPKTAPVGLRDCSARLVHATSTAAHFQVRIDETAALRAVQPRVEVTFVYADGHTMSAIVENGAAVVVPLYNSPLGSTRCAIAFANVPIAAGQIYWYVAPWIPYGWLPNRDLPDVPADTDSAF